MNEIVLTSVGIDIGTTTTQVAVARLTLTNVMPGNRVPKTEITKKEVLFAGQAKFTPFLDRTTIDGAALRELIRNEYRLAGIDKRAIDTGAVIITGETAKKHNAAEIVAAIADLAGDFVVASAGPDLESVIAAKGSGAFEYSARNQCLVANLDIGGGTTNIALIDRGKCIGTACLNVGGRLIEADELTGAIGYYTVVAQTVADYLQVSGRVFGSDRDLATAVLQTMADCVSDYLSGRVVNDRLKSILVMSDKLPMVDPEVIMFSGGVARYMDKAGGVHQPLWHIHGDTGPLLAASLQQTELFRCHQVVPATHTLQATVLGAGAHTVNVSGSTVQIERELLPLRNIPAIAPDCALDYSAGLARVQDGICPAVALILPDLPELTFVELQKTAQSLAVTLQNNPYSPKIVITSQDIAKALGQSLKLALPEEKIICLDAIDIKNGDYLDIGRPLPDQDAVPVIVKTLVFYHE